MPVHCRAYVNDGQIPDHRPSVCKEAHSVSFDEDELSLHPNYPRYRIVSGRIIGHEDFANSRKTHLQNLGSSSLEVQDMNRVSDQKILPLYW